MEELIRTKIAQLEDNFPLEISENKLGEELIAIDESCNDFDESVMCHEFDSAVSILFIT
jgi:hypothetical protein